MYIDNKLVKFWKKLDNIFFAVLKELKATKTKKQEFQLNLLKQH